MKNDLSIVLLILVASFALVGLGMALQRDMQKSHEPIVKEKHDTTYVHDTTFIPQPVPVFLTVDRVETVFLGDTDIVMVEDSLRVPIEQKTYKTDRYKAVVEGWKPNLLSMEIYDNSMVVTNTVVREPSRWSIGLSAGVTATGKGLAPGVTLGLTYNIRLLGQ